MADNEAPRGQAEESLQWLPTDQRKLFERIRARAADVPRLAAQVAELPDDPTDLMSACLREMSSRLFPVMAGNDPERARVLDGMALACIEDDEVVAVFRPFDDGSSRILVTSGLVSLLRLLADLTAVWFHDMAGSGFGRTLRMLRAVRRLDQDERSVPVLAAALRWNIIHRPVWGNSAILAIEPSNPDAIEARDLLAQMAYVFVVAHECAHGILGHTGANAGDWEAEHAADQIAFQAMSAFHADDGAQVSPVFPLVAARLALTAVALGEGSLFVRPPVHHPPGEARWEALAGELGDRRGPTQAAVFTAGLNAAVEHAVDPRRELPPAWWEIAYASPHVHRDIHDPAYYDNFKVFDRLSFGGPEFALRSLER